MNKLIEEYKEAISSFKPRFGNEQDIEIVKRIKDVKRLKEDLQKNPTDKKKEDMKMLLGSVTHLIKNARKEIPD